MCFVAYRRGVDQTANTLTRGCLVRWQGNRETEIRKRLSEWLLPGASVESESERVTDSEEDLVKSTCAILKAAPSGWRLEESVSKL